MLTLLFTALQDTPPAPKLSHDLFGASVDSAGDMNGDGVPDLWVGDPSLFGPGGDDRGRAWCVSGKDGSTLLRIQAPPGSRDYGWTIAALGDVDADGVRDVAVGSLLADRRSEDPAPESDAGVFASMLSAVHVHSGRDGALKYVVRGAGDRVKEPWYSTAAGPALANVGDWNGDGADDLAIGWSYADGELPNQGRVHVVSGRDGSTLHAWFGLEHHDRFGFALARVADVDGDGLSELAAGAVPDHNGAATAPDVVRRTRSGYVRILSSTGKVLRTLHPSDGSPSFGFSLASAPRATREGDDELLVGQPHDGNARFAITRWKLADGDVVQWLKPPPLELWDGGWERRTVNHPSNAVDASFGTRMLAVPDHDGDGKSDVLVTVPQSFCHVPAGVLSSKRTPDSSSVPIGRVALGNLGIEYSHVGIGLSAAGDVDADGVDEFALSGCSVRCSYHCNGCVVLVSGKTLHVVRTFTRAGRE